MKISVTGRRHDRPHKVYIYIYIRDQGDELNVSYAYFSIDKNRSLTVKARYSSLMIFWIPSRSHPVKPLLQPKRRARAWEPVCGLRVSASRAVSNKSLWVVFKHILFVPASLNTLKFPTKNNIKIGKN